VTESRADAEAPIARLTDGVWFQAGPGTWAVPSIRLGAGEWAALIPAGDADPVVDPAGPLARVLATLLPPVRGTMELLERNVYEIHYLALQRLRARLGFVQGYGGLLSNRTLKENIALPLSVHGGRTFEQEVEIIERTLDSYALRPIADMKPSDVDGATRWRACVARALVLEPSWVVLEGIGDWEMDRGRGVSWSRLREYRERGSSAAVICLSRQNPAFEAWFRGEGGIAVRVQPVAAEALPRRPGP
jgi:predicted ABC-type transport system involved in lysophospholipase L1 biosynthesis ATPase subunit